MIFENGNVGACTCRDVYGLKGMCLGNILETNLEDMFFGNRRRAIFKSFMKGKPPAVCRNCSRYIGCDTNLYAIHKSNEEKKK